MTNRNCSNCCATRSCPLPSACRGSMDKECGDIQIDFYPAPTRKPVAWGTVYDECDRPLSGSLVQLVQCTDEKGSCCIVVGQTCSDCNGHYEIPIPPTCQGKYRIEISNPRATQIPRRGQNNICYY